jgi:hypothetical protein
MISLLSKILVLSLAPSLMISLRSKLLVGLVGIILGSKSGTVSSSTEKVA